MIVKVKKINFDSTLAEKAKSALGVFSEMLDLPLDKVPEKMDV